MSQCLVTLFKSTIVVYLDISEMQNGTNMLKTMCARCERVKNKLQDWNFEWDSLCRIPTVWRPLKCMSAILLAAIAEEGMEERDTEWIIEVLGQVVFVTSIWDGVTRWIFFLKDLINLISTFCVCADGFQGFLNLFTTLYRGGNHKEKKSIG